MPWNEFNASKTYPFRPVRKKYGYSNSTGSNNLLQLNYGSGESPVGRVVIYAEDMQEIGID